MVFTLHVFVVSASGNWQENMQLGVGKMCQSCENAWYFWLIPPFLFPQAGNRPAAQLLGSQTYAHISRCLEDRLLTWLMCHVQIEW